QREQLLIPFWKQGSIFRPEHMAVGNRNVTLAMNVLLDIHEPVWPVPVRAAPLIIEERIPPLFPAETGFVVEVLIGHVGTEDREKALDIRLFRVLPVNFTPQVEVLFDFQFLARVVALLRAGGKGDGQQDERCDFPGRFKHDFPRLEARTRPCGEAEPACMGGRKLPSTAATPGIACPDRASIPRSGTGSLRTAL